MKVAFFASEKPREQRLAAAFCAGVRARGDKAEIRAPGNQQIADADVAVMVGVKSRELYRANSAAGVHVMMLDKGYMRHRLEGFREWEYWRVAVDAHHPTKALTGARHKADRWRRFGMEMRPWRADGAHILLAGSSAKYHQFYGLPNPTAYAKEIVRQLRRHTDREIIYRPKPSWRDARPIDGVTYSMDGRSINEDLNGAWAMVTHGSNASFEAALMGVPSIVLGNGIGRLISSTSIEDIEAPLLSDEREQWFSNLAYCQWTLREFASGQAWRVIKGQI